MAVTSEQTVFAYAGILSDFYFGRRIVVTLSVAPDIMKKAAGRI